MIGTLLGLSSNDLKAIELGYPTNARWCCNAMLEKWLEVDNTASWEKIFTAINSPAVSVPCTSDRGKSLFCIAVHGASIILFYILYAVIIASDS